MIISPPFLSAVHPEQNDTIATAAAGNMVVPDGDVCAANMLECAPGNGAYPVSFNLGWHGGAHLIAPTEGNQPAYVRAIADGKVVYVRKTGPHGKPTLHYRNVRTDDGCVVIRHDTEIGEGDNARITYYSVYLHLQTVQPMLAVGKKIYRKDIVGTPGQIYGQYPQIHFEIVCDEANLKKIIGRVPGPVGAQGRTDAIYGDIWFFVPHSTKFFASEPHPYRDDDRAPAVGSLYPQAPVVAAGTGRDMVIRMHYEKDCTLTTYLQKYDGSWSAFGSMPAEHEAEYNLYRRATELNAQYGSATLGNITAGMAVPSPSAIFEMLRFGRCISDQLADGARFNHWRKVKTPDGDGWINLSNAGVRVYSDADFPEWAGWSFIHDDPTPDSQCNSPTMKKWLDVNGSGHVTHADAVSALNVEAVRQRMAHAVCKFPTEWSKAGLEARYNWLKSPHEALANPLSESDFSKLMDHARDFAFWEDVQDADFPPANECWHFPPTAFIRQFRSCGWLSEGDLKRLFTVAPADGQSRAEALRLEMNKMQRKYLIASTRLRAAHFLAQVGHETGWWQYRQELGNERYFRTMYEIITPTEAIVDFDDGFAQRLGLTRHGDTAAIYSQRRPSDVAKKAQGMDNGLVNAIAGGQSGDGARFRGRGFLQITGRRNYAGYSRYRGIDFTNDPHPNLLATDDHNACDASGFFWIREKVNLEADAGSAAQNVARVGGIVNRGSPNRIPLHNVERQHAFDVIWKGVNDA
jgi:predicted chitinase